MNVDERHGPRPIVDPRIYDTFVSPHASSSYSAADVAVQFASQLFEEPAESYTEPGKEGKNSKVLHLVMQVLSTMLNTTPSPFSDSTQALNNSNDISVYSTASIEMGTAGMEFGIVPVIVIGVIFAIATTLGNALVMISIRLDKQLQTISNYFLFSLAVADLTVGMVSIPLMTYYSAHGRWEIGWGMCQFWLSIDYLMCNASVLSLLLISFDRYFSITRPLTYRPRRTTKKALTAIFFAYSISLVLWPPWIIGWPYIEGMPAVDDGTCVVQFLAVGGNRWASQLATIGTAIAAFYLPVSIMIYLYWRVYRETRRRQEQFRQLQAGQGFTPTQIGATSALSSLMLPLHSQGSDPTEVDQPNTNGSDSRRGSRISLRNALNQVQKGGRGCFSCFSKIRGIGARNTFPNESSDSYKDRKSVDKRSKQFFPFVDDVRSVGRKSRPKEKVSWLRYCVGKAGTEISSEESSEIIPANGVDWISAKAEDAVSTDGLPPLSPTTITTNAGGSGRFRSRQAANSETEPMLAQPTPVLHTYTVLIEYKDGESKRPSVRLSSCDSDCYTSTSPPDSNRSSGKRLNGGPLLENGKRRQSLPQENSVPVLNAGTATKLTQQPQSQQNGKYSSVVSSSQRDEIQRKSEKERRKNERRQESKAAKTLSAILFAFIVTWMPYNVIVCWQAFFPGSVPDILFTISYCLCYVNSTINPICYACNGRFLKAYKRILCCRWRIDRRSESLYKHAYLRRT